MISILTPETTLLVKKITNKRLTLSRFIKYLRFSIRKKKRIIFSSCILNNIFLRHLYIHTGYLCERRHLEKTSGCCQVKSLSTRGPYICDSCSLLTNCCTSFEECISCCLKSDHVNIFLFFIKRICNQSIILFSEFIYKITYVLET